MLTQSAELIAIASHNIKVPPTNVTGPAPSTGRSYRLKDRTATENIDKNSSVSKGGDKNDESKDN
jgi:hypothetical protein